MVRSYPGDDRFAKVPEPLSQVAPVQQNNRGNLPRAQRIVPELRLQANTMGLGAHNSIPQLREQGGTGQETARTARGARGCPRLQRKSCRSCACPSANCATPGRALWTVSR